MAVLSWTLVASPKGLTHLDSLGKFGSVEVWTGLWCGLWEGQRETNRILGAGVLQTNLRVTLWTHQPS